LQTLATLRDAVGAMRSLSAHHFRRARQALAAGREYRAEMEAVIAETGLYQPLHPGVPAGLLVVASDLGLCGDYNSRLGQTALAEVQRYPDARIYSVGRRGRGNLVAAGLVLGRQYDAPASIEALPRLLLELAQEVLADYQAAKIGSLRVVSASFAGVGHFAPVSAAILPIQPVATGRPLRRSPYVDAQYLAAVAVREFLYISLYEILLDAVAAEHGMRLMAAESALQWLDATATTTSRRLATARGESTTQELLDIVAGVEQRLRTELA
jgi:F-type H+-transporting ATPase subunit gamma